MRNEQVQLHGGTRSTTMVCGTVERVLLNQQEWLPPGTLILKKEAAVIFNKKLKIVVS